MCSNLVLMAEGGPGAGTWGAKLISRRRRVGDRFLERRPKRMTFAGFHERVGELTS